MLILFFLTIYKEFYMAYTQEEVFKISLYMGVPVWGINKNVFVQNAISGSQAAGSVPIYGTIGGQDPTGQCELYVRNQIVLIDKYLEAIDANMDINLASEVDGSKISPRLSNEEYRRRVCEVINNIATAINCPIYKPYFSSDINTSKYVSEGRG
jgi:hypothetical protein